jgi:hypothetical protein
MTPCVSPLFPPFFPIFPPFFLHRSSIVFPLFRGAPVVTGGRFPA